MAKSGIVRQPTGSPLSRRSPDGLRLPETDNAPGAPEALLRANKLLRGRRWPAPYDRTRHEMVVGDARDLSFLPSESVHLVVTSPPYFNLKLFSAKLRESKSF